jgi:chromosome segregation ATPase
MTDDITTRPMLEALLDGQRQLGSQLVDLRTAVDGVSQNQSDLASKQDALAAKQDALAAKQDEFAAKQDEFAAKQDALAAKVDALETRVVALIREVRDGFDEYNRKINALNQRLLSFETWLSRIDDRLHDEIVARTR